MSGTPPHQGRIANIANTAQSYSQMAVIFAGNNSSNRTKSSQEELNRVLMALFLSDPYVDRETIIAAKGARVPGTCEWITYDEKYSAWLSGKSIGDHSDKSKPARAVTEPRRSNGCFECRKRKIRCDEVKPECNICIKCGRKCPGYPPTQAFFLHKFDASTNVLWISGGPGTGKTMLSIFLTEKLENYTAPIDNTDVIFFFCDKHNWNNTASALLRGLIHQIISKRPQLVRHAIPYFTGELIQQTLSSSEKLWEIFSKLITDTELGTMFCVLDGLNEGGDVIIEKLLPDMIGVFGRNTSSSANSSTRFAFNLLIIGRGMPGLRGVPWLRLEDNRQKLLHDIKLFIVTRLDELSRIAGFDEIRDSVQGDLLEYSGGSFQWISVAIHHMSHKKTCDEIQEVLQNLKLGFLAYYGRILPVISPPHREASREILKWVAFSARPLRLQELAAAVRIETSKQIDIEATISLWRPLLKIDRQVATLAHHSVRDYLLYGYPDSNAVLGGFRLENSGAHCELMKACIDCIMESDLSHTVTEMAPELSFERSPLLQYAVYNWPLHAIQCPTLAASYFDSGHPLFNEDSSLRDSWWAAYSGEEASNRSALYMACSSGVVPWIEKLLSRSEKREKSHQRHVKKHQNDIEITEEVLQITARNERNGQEVMRLLLDKRGDDISVTNEVLKIAIENKGVGYHLLEVLLEHQSNIQITEDILYAASRNDTDYKLFFLLLDHKDATKITNETTEAATRNMGAGEELWSLIERPHDAQKQQARAQSIGLSSKEDQRSDLAESTIFSSQVERVTDASSVSGRCAFSAFQSQQGNFEQNDDASIISKDTVDMTREQDDEVIINFADALYESTLESGVSFDRFNMNSDALLKSKIKKFSQRVKEDNPREVHEFKPKRKAAKAIQRLSQDISSQFARKLLDNVLPASRAELEAISERPFREIDIPSESMEQKLQRLEFNNVETSAVLFDTSHDHEDGFESVESSDSDTSVVHTRPDFASLHNYFKTHPAFGVLISDIQQLMKHFHYDALKHIRQSVYQSMEKTLNSMELSENVYKAQFHASWDLLRFLEERRSYGLNDDLDPVLTITGNSQAAQLETVANFIHQTWNAQSSAFLSVLQKAISGSDVFDNETSDIRITLEKGRVSVSATGSKESLVAIAQQLAWLGAACAPSEEQLPSKTHRYAYYRDTIWTQDDSKPDTFYVSYVTVPVDEDEPLPSWTSLFDGPCIASGYPISARSENQAGLQLPQEFLGISEPVSGRPTGQGKKSVESSGQFFIPGEPKCNLERILQISGQTKNLVSLEEEVNGTRSIFQYFRRSLVGLKRRYEQSDVERYGLKSSKRLSHVVAEILDADPGSVEWSSKDPISFLDTFKNRFEDWTREEWDWWPLKPPKRALRSNEARLYWTSICGERRWAETPEDFAKMTTEIAKACALRIERFAHSASSQSPAATPSQPPPPSANTSSSNTIQTSTTNVQKIIGPSSPSNNINLGTTTSKMNGPSSVLTPQHIFLVVASGNDIRLAQIRVENMTTDRFFHELREQYNRLRSFSRKWFSIWVYSHCDFYRCDKYEAHHYEPRKEEFPVGTDYDYDPRPVELMPPISPRQFKKRYYACYNPRPHLHFYHKCTAFNKATADHLKYFPKRNLNLVEDSDKQEVFWGIFAREEPSTFRLVLYHFACALPCIIFFFLWLFEWGHAGDLQNASVPISIMMVFLSVFWSIYFANLEIGRSMRR